MTRDRLTVFRDGRPVRSLNIGSIPVRNGGIYFFSFGDSTARLRNIRLRAEVH